MHLTVHNDDLYAVYKVVVDSFGSPDRVYYSKNANGVLRIVAIVGEYRHSVAVSYDDAQGPSEGTLTGDFPVAIEANITSIAY